MNAAAQPHLVWVLFLASLMIGVGLGYMRGGRLRSTAIPTSALILIILALGAQIAIGRISGFQTSVVMVFSYLVALSCLALIWRSVRILNASRLSRIAVVILVVGTLLNAVVIIANGGMPVSPRALELAGQADTDVSGGLLPKHVDLDSATHLRALADVIPVRPLHTVVSVGDILVLLGITAFVAASMAGTRPRHDEVVATLQ
jgi:hypothetical protein